MTDDSGSHANAGPATQALGGGARAAAPWGAIAGLAVVAGLAVLDPNWRGVISATVVIGPFVTALLGTPRQTVAVAVAAVAACAASGAWNDNFGSDDYLLRLVVVVAGAGIAVSTARSRMRLSRDRVRFHLLSAAAEISDAAGTVQETIQRLSDLLVPELADVCVMDVVRDGVTDRRPLAAPRPPAGGNPRGPPRRARGAGGGPPPPPAGAPR